MPCFFFGFLGSGGGGGGGDGSGGGGSAIIFGAYNPFFNFQKFARINDKSHLPLSTLANANLV